MRSVVYSMTVSLDGYIADANGQIDWSAPDEELFRFHTQQTRALGAHLCGRGLYEAMLIWETIDESNAAAVIPDFGPAAAEFAQVWKPIPKVVFSNTLSTVEGNARLARESLSDELAAVRDVSDGKAVGVGGARLAAGLIALDLIDEYRQFISPVMLGGGTPYFPRLDHRLELELVDTRTFASRVIYACYRRSRTA